MLKCNFDPVTVQASMTKSLLSRKHIPIIDPYFSSKM